MRKNHQQVLSSVAIRSQLWSREVTELFDFETRSIFEQNFTTNQSAVIVKQGNSIKVFQNPKDVYKDSNTIYLARIDQIDDNYTIQPCVQNLDGLILPKSNRRKQWLVVKSLPPNQGVSGYYLVKDELIKIGKLIFKVIKVSTKNKGCYQDLKEILNENDNEEESEILETHNLPCRICLCNEYYINNPLISPCQCSGTMKYVHLKCLQQWLKSRMQIKASEHKLIIAQSYLKCDLCGQMYPNKMLIDGHQQSLIKLPKIKCPHIILQNQSKEALSNQELTIISFGKKNKLRMGRGDVDVKLQDISVSRYHCELWHVGQSIFLLDHQSRFGTTIRIMRPLQIQNKPIIVQAGSCLITVNLKRPWSLIPSCFRSINEDLTSFNILPFNTGIPISISDPMNAVLSKSQNLNKTNIINNDSSFTLPNDQFQEVEAITIRQQTLNTYKNCDMDSDEILGYVPGRQSII